MNIDESKYVLESACSTDTASLYSIRKYYWKSSTAFSNVVIAESPVYGKVLFLDNELQSSESDEAIYHEHLVHPVLNATSHIPGKRVLIVGGGEGATAREVLKWPQGAVAHVDWVDIDVELCDLCRLYMNYADDSVYKDVRLKYYGEDIRLFFEKDVGEYDVIILDLPDPDVEDLLETKDGDLLYGKSFWMGMVRHLKAGGAIVSHAGPIAPGGDPMKRRAGLEWLQHISSECGTGKGIGYHTCIPSFQSEWGFWMSINPLYHNNFPEGLLVMDAEAQSYAFAWPKFWMSPDVGQIANDIVNVNAGAGRA